MSRSNNSRKGSRTRHKSSMNHKKIGKYSVVVLIAIVVSRVKTIKPNNVNGNVMLITITCVMT